MKTILHLVAITLAIAVLPGCGTMKKDKDDDLEQAVIATYNKVEGLSTAQKKLEAGLNSGRGSLTTDIANMLESEKGERSETNVMNVEGAFEDGQWWMKSFTQVSRGQSNADYTGVRSFTRTINDTAEVGVLADAKGVTTVILPVKQVVSVEGIDSGTMGNIPEQLKALAERDRVRFEGLTAFVEVDGKSRTAMLKQLGNNRVQVTTERINGVTRIIEGVARPLSPIYDGFRTVADVLQVTDEDTGETVDVTIPRE